MLHLGVSVTTVTKRKHTVVRGNEHIRIKAYGPSYIMTNLLAL